MKFLQDYIKAWIGIILAIVLIVKLITVLAPMLIQ